MRKRLKEKSLLKKKNKVSPPFPYAPGNYRRRVVVVF